MLIKGDTGGCRYFIIREFEKRLLPERHVLIFKKVEIILGVLLHIRSHLGWVILCPCHRYRLMFLNFVGNFFLSHEIYYNYITSILQFVFETREKTKSKKVVRNPFPDHHLNSVCFKLSPSSFSLKSIKNFDTSVSFGEKEIKMNFL